MLLETFLMRLLEGKGAAEPARACLAQRLLARDLNEAWDEEML